MATLPLQTTTTSSSCMTMAEAETGVDGGEMVAVADGAAIMIDEAEGGKIGAVNEAAHDNGTVEAATTPAAAAVVMPLASPPMSYCGWDTCRRHLTTGGSSSC